MTMMAYFRHETAWVDEGAEIGEGCRIWHFVTSAPGQARPRLRAWQNVFVAKTAVLGSCVRVQNNVSIYDGVVLKTRVFVGPSAVFTNVVNPRAHVSRKSEYRQTVVGRGATIGANATIVCGHQIGPYAFIGAGAVVTRDVPAHQLWVGVPARFVGWVCACGERLSRRFAALCGLRKRLCSARRNLMRAVVPLLSASLFLSVVTFQGGCASSQRIADRSQLQSELELAFDDGQPAERPLFAGRRRRMADPIRSDPAGLQTTALAPARRTTGKIRLRSIAVMKTDGPAPS